MNFPSKESLLLSQASLKLQSEIRKQNSQLRQLEAKLQAREKTTRVQSLPIHQQNVPLGKMIIKSKGLIMRVKNTGAIEAELKQTKHRADEVDDRDDPQPKPVLVPDYPQHVNPRMRYHADDPVYQEPQLPLAPRQRPYQTLPPRPHPEQQRQPPPQRPTYSAPQAIYIPQQPVYAASQQPDYYEEYEEAGYDQAYEQEVYQQLPPPRPCPPQQAYKPTAQITKRRSGPIRHSLVAPPQRKRVAQSPRHPKPSVRDYLYEEEAEVEEYMEEEEQEDARAYKQPPQPSNGFRIIVSNLHPAVTLGDVEELFTAIGPVRSVGMLLPGVAELVYKYEAHADEAVDKYHNRDLDGQPMQVIYEVKNKKEIVQRRTKKKALGHFVAPSRQEQPKQRSRPARQERQERPLVKKQPDRRFVPKSQQRAPISRQREREGVLKKPVKSYNSFKTVSSERRGNTQRRPSANHSFTITM